MKILLENWSEIAPEDGGVEEHVMRVVSIGSAPLVAS